jgi:hypothetical protein
MVLWSLRCVVRDRIETAPLYAKPWSAQVGETLAKAFIGLAESCRL